MIPFGSVGMQHCAQIPNLTCGERSRFSAASPPPGLTLDETGLLCGAPTQAGRQTFAVTYESKDGCVVTGKVRIDAECPPIAIESNPVELPDGTQGVAYGPIVFSASGGTEPYTFSIPMDSLPAGVTLTGNTLSGAPTESGSFPFTVSVTDKYGCTATRGYSIYIVCTVACPVGVPTLSEWALWLFMIGMAGAGVLMMRRVM